jgi:protein-S-isoprenylcysteine O-methyltransferase Ste14
MDLRYFLFSNRSFTPIPLVLVILYLSSFSYPYFIIGIGLIVIGESIRIYGVRFAGGATRTREVGAPSLCTSGPYSRCRNPLYLGNMIIYCGVVLMAGGQFLWPLLFIVFIFFTLQYSMIISLEEETLVKLFGNEYQLYRESVPKLFPRISPWLGNDKRVPLTMIQTLKTEKRTLQNIIIIIILIGAKNYYRFSL